MKLPSSWTTVTLLSKILAIILFVSLPFAGFYFGNKYQQDSQITPADSSSSEVKKDVTKWVKPISTDKAIPIIKKDNKLYWYSMTKKQLNPTKYKTSWGGGSYGQGEDRPLPSPDGKFIAFINREDNYLYILPSGASEAIKVTDYSVDYLNSWSTDSSKILYYSNLNNINISKEPEGMGFFPAWETSVSFTKGASPGFHYFNIENGQDTFLYPLITADKFIDKNRILVEMNHNEDKSQRLVLFNVDTFTADFSTVSYPIKSSALQKSFSADGTLWARTVDGGYSGTEVKILFSKFPNDEGDTVITGSWAFVQRPLLNSSGKYLAYTKKGDQIKQGQYAGQYPDKTIVWDTVSKKIVTEQNGSPTYWVDEDTLLIGRSEYGNNFTSFTSYNLLNAKSLAVDVISVE